METITRKSMLYKTGVEYGDYTINHALGCSHGCKFPCYAFLMKKRFGQVKTYEDWCKPKIVANTLDLLDKEIPRIKDKIKSVHLCFSTDPFMYGVLEVGALSIAAVRKLNDAGIKCTVLTKGLLPIELSELSKANEYGITLVSLDEDYRRRMEPGASPYAERIAALKALHKAGCKTWISMEPYPTPNLIKQAHWKIIEAVSFVDKIIFGRTNYNPEVTAYLREDKNFYKAISRDVADLCKYYAIDCHIKEGTQKK